MFWDKPKVKFHCLIPGVAETMPIIEARDYKHPWVDKAHQEYNNARKNPNWGMERSTHTARCPGIFTLQRHGWIQRAWQDFTIETFQGSDEFVWSSPLDQKKYCEVTGDYISAHPKEQLANYMENWRADTLKTVIKVQSPWRCEIPKGYRLLEMSVPYADEKRFSVAPGFSSNDMGYAQMNVQMLWHVTKGKTLIKAGTPLAQYILVPEESFDMEIKITDDKVAKTQNIILNNKFVRDYGMMRDMFNKIGGK